MREAIQNGDLHRYREFLDFGKSRGNPDRRLALRIGISMFRQSGVMGFDQGQPGYLDELRDIAAAEHTEVSLSPEPFINDVSGAVALAFHWISGEEETKVGNLLLVQAWPLSKTMGFTGRDTELMARRKWMAAKPNVIKDALARAYDKPITTGW